MALKKATVVLRNGARPPNDSAPKRAHSTCPTSWPALPQGLNRSDATRRRRTKAAVIVTEQDSESASLGCAAGCHNENAHDTFQQARTSKRALSMTCYMSFCTSVMLQPKHVTYARMPKVLVVMNAMCINASNCLHNLPLRDALRHIPFCLPCNAYTLAGARCHCFAMHASGGKYNALKYENTRACTKHVLMQPPVAGETKHISKHTCVLTQATAPETYQKGTKQKMHKHKACTHDQ